MVTIIFRRPRNLVGVPVTVSTQKATLSPTLEDLVSSAKGVSKKKLCPKDATHPQ